MEVISHKIVKARKRHICGQCGHPIDQGTRHVSEIRTDGGYRSHLECDRAAAHIYRKYRRYYDDGVNLQDCLEDDTDRELLVEHHPAVALRFGLVLTPYF